MRFSAARRGFTLIELLVVITILGILAIGAYVPYQRYEHVARVRLAAERVEQTVIEARTLATSGYMMPGTETNADLGVLLRLTDKKITILAYPHGTATGSISALTASGAARVRTIDLPPSVTFASLPGDVHSLLLYFSAPRADSAAYDLDGAVPRELPAGSGAVVLGFSGSTAPADEPGSLLRSVVIHF